jgi:hypothetical protein
LIEVAFFMSSFSDAADAGEGKGKERTPKGCIICRCTAWAWSEQLHDCHRRMGSYRFWHSYDLQQICDAAKKINGPAHQSRLIVCKEGGKQGTYVNF